MNRRHYAVTLQQASEDSPLLARLTALTRDSSDRLKAIEMLIPAALRPAIQAGPIDGLVDDLDDEAIERSIAEINEAIRRSAARKA